MSLLFRCYQKTYDVPKKELWEAWTLNVTSQLRYLLAQVDCTFFFAISGFTLRCCGARISRRNGRQLEAVMRIFRRAQPPVACRGQISSVRGEHTLGLGLWVMLGS